MTERLDSGLPRQLPVPHLAGQLLLVVDDSWWCTDAVHHFVQTLCRAHIILLCACLLLLLCLSLAISHL